MYFVFQKLILIDDGNRDESLALLGIRFVVWHEMTTACSFRLCVY